MSDFETVPPGTLELLEKVTAERDALTAHVERLREALTLAKGRIDLLANVATSKGASVYAAHDIWPGEMDQVLEEAPSTLQEDQDD